MIKWSTFPEYLPVWAKCGLPHDGSRGGYPPEKAKKVFGLLASEMDKNSDAELTRREFIDVALNSDLSTLRSVADNFNDERKAPLCERMFKIGVKKASQVTPESIVPV